MAETSSGPSDLTARLQQQAAHDRQQIEAVIQTELAQLSANSKAIVQREFHTIERDIQRGSHRLRAAALTAWTRPLVIGLLILLGISGGTGRVTWCCPWGRSTTRGRSTRTIGPGPCAGSLPCRFRASEGVL